MKDGRSAFRTPRRPRTRPPVQRLTVEIDRELFDKLDQASRDFGMSYRAIIEEALKLWLKEQGPR